MIDSLLHPLSDHNAALMVLDGVLHALAEQKPAETAAKFIRHTLPKIIEETTRNRGK